MQVLFVCTGNTCRSCMAEAIFNSVSKLKDVKAISAGVAIVPGSKTSKNTSLIVKEKFSRNLTERYAVQLNEDMVRQSNLILTMTAYIKDFLIKQFPQFKNKIYTLNEYVKLNEDIVDPYGGDVKTYEATFEMLNKSICLLLNKIEGDNGVVKH